MEFLAEYGLFFAKVITVVIAIIIVIAAIAAQSIKGKHGGTNGFIEVRHINEQFDDYEKALQHAVLDEDTFKKALKEKKKAHKATKKKGPEDKPRIFVLDFDGDVKASDVDLLSEEITAVLTIARKEDEVVVNIESPGGMVHTYGLAASQLQRIRADGIPLTICVDKVAASGGYLMACVGNRILAAPFAIIGSIGVLAQVPNFNRILKKFDVDYDVMTAGEYKAPITMFGENTEKGKQKLQQELEETHVLFQNFIAEHRPQVDVTKVATGEVWYGQKAIEQQLVDEIITSDSYLMRNRKDKDIYHVSYVEKKSIQEKLGLAISYAIDKSMGMMLKKEREVNVGKSLS